MPALGSPGRLVRRASIVTTAAAALFATALPETAFAHGAVTDPPSRTARSASS